MQRALAPLMGARGAPALHAALQWYQHSQYGAIPPTGNQWEWMKLQGHKINPCNSPLHPAVAEGLELEQGQRQLSVQEAYTPSSLCYGCGPAATEGLGLRSYRIPGGLEVCFGGGGDGQCCGERGDCTSLVHAPWQQQNVIIIALFLSLPTGHSDVA